MASSRAEILCVLLHIICWAYGLFVECPSAASCCLNMFAALLQPRVLKYYCTSWGGVQAMKDKVEGEYNVSQVSAVTQGLDGTPVVLIQVHCS